LGVAAVPAIAKRRGIKIFDHLNLRSSQMLRNFSQQMAGVALSFVFTLGLSVCCTSSQAMASTPTLIRSVDYTFVYPDLPDPAVWETWTNTWGGSVIQVPIDGRGLAMQDPDNGASLLYIHDMPELSGDPGNPNYGNTLTFQVRSQVPYVFDGSLAWSGDAVGWQMIVDDGNHRIELALSRSATFERTVRIQNCPAFVPVPFPWDNELENTYEMVRLENGYYQITLYNADASLPPVTSTIAGGSLPPSGGVPHIAWGMGIQGGGAAYWMQAHAEVYGPTPKCVNVPSMDTNNDCKIDFAEFASQWMTCGYDIESACFE
jgi:hypothetical protein